MKMLTAALLYLPGEKALKVPRMEKLQMLCWQKQPEWQLEGGQFSLANLVSDIKQLLGKELGKYSY